MKTAVVQVTYVFPLDDGLDIADELVQAVYEIADHTLLEVVSLKVVKRTDKRYMILKAEDPIAREDNLLA